MIPPVRQLVAAQGAASLINLAWHPHRTQPLPPVCSPSWSSSKPAYSQWIDNTAMLPEEIAQYAEEAAPSGQGLRSTREEVNEP